MGAKHEIASVKAAAIPNTFTISTMADEFIPDTEESDACVWSPGSETGMQGSDLMRSKRTRQTSPVKARLHTPSPPPAAYTAADTAAQAPTETATEQEQASADEIGAVAPVLGFVAGTGMPVVGVNSFANAYRAHGGYGSRCQPSWRSDYTGRAVSPRLSRHQTYTGYLYPNASFAAVRQPRCSTYQQQERYTVTSEEVSVPDKPEESTAIEEHEEIAEEECVADEFIPDTEESDACVWSPGSETG